MKISIGNGISETTNFAQEIIIEHYHNGKKYKIKESENGIDIVPLSGSMVIEIFKKYVILKKD